MSLLQIEGLTLDLHGKRILENIDHRLEEGEFQLVIGPNGAGKSSLLKCMLGLYAFSGTIRLDGRPLARLGARERARLVAYVPQFLELQFNLDVAGFMALSRYAYDEPAATRDKIIEEALAQTETTQMVGAFLDELSGGERQRVMIAAALAQRPRLLLLDEPSTAMDPAHRRDLVALLARLNREGQTLLVVTHDWNEYVHLNPKVTALKQGRKAIECQASQLRDHLEPLFGCAFNHYREGDAWISLTRIT
jgi:iron complex transport system ATP-binding protein